MDYKTRDQWGAEFNVTPVPTIHTPVPYIFIHHPVGTTTDDPADDMLTIERIDINKFGKPSYDWGIHPSGIVLEGMTTHLSPDTLGYNSTSLSIMFMGNFEVDQPTDAAMYAGRELVARIGSYGWLSDGWLMKGHRDVYATACPGANLYPRIQELTVPPPISPNKEEEMYACRTSDGAYRSFAVKRDGRIYETVYSGGASWQQPVLVLNGATPALSRGPISGICEGARVDLFVIGNNFVQYHAYRATPAQSWVWEELPGNYS